MFCPICKDVDCKVTDSKLIGGDRRRRYLCPECGKRFSTREIYDDSPFGKKRTKSGIKKMILGIECEVNKETFHKTYDVYTFTVPGWNECTVTGLDAAKRTIRGRLDFATRNTLGIDAETKGVE